MLWLGIIQAFVALWARFGHDNLNSPANPNYSHVDTRSDSGLSDAELGIPPPPVLSSGGMILGGGNCCYSNYDYKEPERTSTPEVPSSYPSSGTSSDGIPVDAASLAAIAAHAHGGGGGGMSRDRMAAIAANLS